MVQISPEATKNGGGGEGEQQMKNKEITSLNLPT